MHAVGAADAERVHVLARPRDQRVAVVRARRPRGSCPAWESWSAERGVEHVGGGEPVVDPAPRLADRARHDVHEGGHVVVGHLLALLDRLDREGGALADRAPRPPRARRPARPARPRPPAPPGARCRACAARTTPPPSPGACSARSRARGCAPPARRRSGRCPPPPSPRARRAASARSRAARRGRRPTEVFEVSGTPITGRSVCAATTPGSAAARPGAGDDHAQPAHARVLRVLGDRVGVAVRAHHADLVADAALLELLRRLLHQRHVALRAHHDADLRRVVHVELVELVLDLRLGVAAPARP